MLIRVNILSHLIGTNNFPTGLCYNLQPHCQQSNFPKTQFSFYSFFIPKTSSDFQLDRVCNQYEALCIDVLLHLSTLPNLDVTQYIPMATLIYFSFPKHASCPYMWSFSACDLSIPIPCLVKSCLVIKTQFKCHFLGDFPERSGTSSSFKIILVRLVF